MKWISCIVLTTILLFGMSASLVSGEENGTGDMMSLYSDFLDAKTSMKYEIQTRFRIEPNLPDRSFSDTYFFSDQVVYQKLNGNVVANPFDSVERLVVHGESGDSSYYRNYRSPEYCGRKEIIPFFQEEDPAIRVAILGFFDNPVFHLGTIDVTATSTITLDVAGLSAESRAYLQAELRRVVPTLTLPAGGTIIYSFTTDGTRITRIIADYRALFEGSVLFSQTITPKSGTTLDWQTLIAGALDLGQLASWETSTLPKMVPGDTISFENEFTSYKIQVAFVRIDTAGEYLFSTTSSARAFQQEWWFLLDFDLKSYRPLKTCDNKSLFPMNVSSIYLEPGIYWLYLCTRWVNVDSLTLTLSPASPPDDSPGTFAPGLPSVSQTSTLTFITDYVGDQDAFLVTGDYDVVFVQHGTDVASALDETVFPTKDRYDFYAIENPGFDFLWYLTGSTVGSHTVTLTFYSYSDAPAPFSEAPVIDLYDPSVPKSSWEALPFRGGQDTYAIDLPVDTDLFVSSKYSSTRIYDEEYNLVTRMDQICYSLSAGKYYVNFFDFTDFYSTFWIYSEPLGEDPHLVDPSSGTMWIRGFVHGSADVDLYQMTFTTDTAIRIVYPYRPSLLLYGVDNPRIIFLSQYENEYVIPAGTYYLTYPMTSGPTELHPYDFYIEILTPETEGSE